MYNLHHNNLRAIIIFTKANILSFPGRKNVQNSCGCFEIYIIITMDTRWYNRIAELISSVQAPTV